MKLKKSIFGQFLPDALATRGYGLDQIIGQLYLGTEGILGIPIMVSTTYIFLFILFGCFLEHAGMINLFNDLALGTFGHFRGGPAKVAVISSGTMGMISGSGVANVLTVGAFTIPLMKPPPCYHGQGTGGWSRHGNSRGCGSTWQWLGVSASNTISGKTPPDTLFFHQRLSNMLGGFVQDFDRTAWARGRRCRRGNFSLPGRGHSSRNIIVVPNSCIIMSSLFHQQHADVLHIIGFFF